MGIWRYFLRAFSVKGIKYGMILLFIALFLSIIAIVPREEDSFDGILKDEKITLNENIPEITFTGIIPSELKFLNIMDREYKFTLQQNETRGFKTDDVLEIEISGEVRYEYTTLEYPYSPLGIPAFLLFIVGILLVMKSTSVYISEVTEEIKEKSKKH